MRGEPEDETSVDLFAATIILFIMYTGVKPFNLALKSDQLYKLLQDRPKFFWRYHSKKFKDNISEDFKDLI